MSLVQKALAFWLVILFAIIILYVHHFRTSAFIYLPLSQPILSITLPNDVIISRADSHSPWFVDDQLADEKRVNEMIKTLKLPCKAVYDKQAVDGEVESSGVKFKVGEDRFMLGQYQALTKTHYIYHFQQVYLCHEAIKYYLSQSKAYWLKGQ